MIQYFLDRDRLAADVVAGRVQPTVEGLAAAFERRGGYGPFEAADNALKFLEDLGRQVDRRNKQTR